MTDPRIPAGPLERDPAGPFIPHEEQLALLGEALGGVILGAYDHRIIGWLAGWDTGTVLTMCSLICVPGKPRRPSSPPTWPACASGAATPPLLTCPHDWPPERPTT